MATTDYIQRGKIINVGDIVDAFNEKADKTTTTADFDKKVNKSGDTMTGALYVPDITL